MNGADTRRFHSILRKGHDEADWMVDDAVCCELLSAVNSLIIRENTGNFLVSDLTSMI